jgi:phosphoesterase RecJ-like protein
VTISQDDVKKHNLELTSLAGFVNFLSEISGIDVVAILYEGDDGKTNISLRSKKADVNAVAAHFGGGGHKNASGAVVDATLETVKGQLIEILEKL